MGPRPVATGRAVWVLRHAKAAQHADDDHSRPLTSRGTRQAAELARYLAASPVAGVALPGTVVCSSARRAVQTAELVAVGLGPDVELFVEDALYHADADDVLDRLRALADDGASVMVVGHNPTLHDVALLLLAGADDAGRSRLEQGFPTAALAVVALPAVSWGAVAPGTGTLLDLWTPGRAERGRPE